MSDTEDILLHMDAGVLTLTLNRPTFRNAIASEMVPRLCRILGEAQANPKVRCLLITGAGDHFTAGGDVVSFQKTLELSTSERQEEFRRRLDRAAEMVEAFLAFDRPIVARVRGAVAGAGLMFSLVADLVLADETATFVFAHQRMGLVPDGGVSWLLPRIVGIRQAKRLLLTAAKIDAAEALELGLVTAIHSTQVLDGATTKAVTSFARAPQEAVKAAKMLLDQSLSETSRRQLEAERDSIVRCVGNDDFAEAVTAFLEKRSPRFPSAQ